MNESRQLARFVSELKYEHLPPEVIARAKDLILDQVGIMMGVSTLPWSKIVYEYVREWGDEKRESTIAHYGYKTKAENAVFANSSFGHGFEIDDHYLPGQSHPGCIVVPSALAMAEKESATGKDVILAVAAGYEVMGRINKAIVPSCILRGFHAPTSITGPFGAAAVAGKVLNFDPELMVHALSIAGSHAGGTIEYDQSGGSVKRMHAGMAAHGGLRSAFLAQKGLTGPPTILEGKHGFCQAFADKYNLQEITDNGQIEKRCRAPGQGRLLQGPAPEPDDTGRIRTEVPRTGLGSSRQESGGRNHQCCWSAGSAKRYVGFDFVDVPMTAFQRRRDALFGVACVRALFAV